MRVNVVTGSASGIGKATKELLENRGEKVIGVDLHDPDVLADLGTVEGREQMAADVERLSDGKIDAVFSIAGLAGQTATCASVNSFGMIATLTGLRPLLQKSDAPRAVLPASVMSLYPFDEKLRAAFEASDEPAARTRADQLGVEDPENFTVYNTTKSSVALWVRRNAISDDWSGSGITLNGVAPGMVHTPLVQDLDNEEGHKVVSTFPRHAPQRLGRTVRGRRPDDLPQRRCQQTPHRPDRLYRRRDRHHHARRHNLVGRSQHFGGGAGARGCPGLFLFDPRAPRRVPVTNFRHTRRR